MADNLLDNLLEDSAEGDEENFFEEEDKKLSPLLDEIELISDQAIRFFVRSVLLRADDFWESPAGYAGLHYPPDELAPGGNVLHVKRMMRIVGIIAKSQDRSGFETDLLFAATLIHDITKARKDIEDNYIYDPMHPYTVDAFVQHCIHEDAKYTMTTNRSTTMYLDDETISQILRYVRCHLGLWSPIPETYPLSTMDWTIHLADHIASKLHTIIDGDKYDQRRWDLDEPSQPETP